LKKKSPPTRNKDWSDLLSEDVLKGIGPGTVGTHNREAKIEKKENM